MNGQQANRKLVVALAGVCATGMAVESPAAALLLDFGSMTATGSALTSSPAYADSTLPLASLPRSPYIPTWNKVGGVDATAGSLTYAGGSPAANVAYDLTCATNTSTAKVSSLTFNWDTTSQPTGIGSTTAKTGVYTSPSVAGDAVWAVGSSIYTAMGLRISGLATGDYRVYVTARNVYSTSSVPDRVCVAATTNEPGYTIPTSGATVAVETNSNVADTGSWLANENYVVIPVTLTADNPYLTIVTQGEGTGERRGFFNSIEIVSVPEPASLSLALLVGGLAVGGRRRRLV